MCESCKNNQCSLSGKHNIWMGNGEHSCASWCDDEVSDQLEKYGFKKIDIGYIWCGVESFIDGFIDGV